MKHAIAVLCFFVCVTLSTSAVAQVDSQTQRTPQSPAVAPPAQRAGTDVATGGAALPVGTAIRAELNKSVDAKKAKPGDPLVARVTADVKSGDTVLIPRGSKVLGQVTQAQPYEKGGTQSTLGIAFTKVVSKEGTEMPLTASIQAISPPANSNPMSQQAPSASGLPGGNPGAMGAPGQGPTGAAPGSATSAADNTPSEAESPMKGMSISQSTQGIVFSSPERNVKLESGAQLVLRVEGK